MIFYYYEGTDGLVHPYRQLLLKHPLEYIKCYLSIHKVNRAKAKHERIGKRYETAKADLAAVKVDLIQAQDVVGDYRDLNIEFDKQDRLRNMFFYDEIGGLYDK